MFTKKTERPQVMAANVRLIESVLRRAILLLSVHHTEIA